MFDHFAGSYGLMCVAFFEIFAVIYVYGYRRFVRDLEFMTGEPVSRYWTFIWRFIAPTILIFVFLCSIGKTLQARAAIFGLQQPICKCRRSREATLDEPNVFSRIKRM